MDRSKKPGTAGRLITESELRAYAKCSKYHAFGGLYSPDDRLAVIQYAIEKAYATALRKNLQDPILAFTNAVQEKARSLERWQSLMEPQQADFVRECILLGNQVIKAFPAHEFLQVTSVYPFKVKLSKTPIQLSVSAIFKTPKKKTLHFISFNPYSGSHAAYWDIPSHLKIQYLKQHVPEHNLRKHRAIGHIFGLSEKGSKLHHTTIYDTDINEDLLKSGLRLIQNMERSYSMPLLPCPYTCEFKKRCLPKGVF